MIADLYHQHRAAPSDIVEHLDYFVETCRELDAKKVIELGVRWGTSTAAWLYGLEKTDGQLWSVDVSPPPQIDSDRWTFLQGHDLDPIVLVELPYPVDVVFVDTIHQYQHTLEELETYVPKVRPGGRVLLHDTELETPEDHMAGDPPFPVKTAVAEFCTKYDLEWSNRPFCYGLATIQIEGR